MKAYIFTPGDLICRKGEVAREMFIIADGILEVMSETGRVLTTMKAGDFFGEIGILNLDGLNKRTADVRSVGYSELFSLSREDVLAAMKDYPEAQDILQSLGRKRLMEARNVNKPRAPGQSGDGKGGGGEGGKEGVAGVDGDSRAGKRIVEKLRSDVKGLKNALRKSRRGTRTKDETLELQPLTPGVVDVSVEGSGSGAYSSGKGMLRRMSRVRSDDTEEPSGSSEQPVSPTEKLGAGLPLLHRLKLLKEKQDREEKGKALLSPTSSTPPTGSLSPPSSNATIKPDPPQEEEVIGAGLPLIQRLMLLKQKEEKERLAALQATASGTAEVLSSAVKSSEASTSKSKESSLSPPTTGDESRHSSSKEHSEDDSSSSKRSSSILNRLVSLKHKENAIVVSKPSTSVVPKPSTSVVSKSSTSVVSKPSTSVVSKPITSVVSKPSTSAALSPEAGVSESSTSSKTPLLRDKLKILVQKEFSSANSGVSSSSQLAPVASTSGTSSGTSHSVSGPPPMKKQQSWSLLKKAAIVSATPPTKHVEPKVILSEVSKTLISPCVATKIPPLLGIITSDQSLQAKLTTNVCEPSSPLQSELPSKSRFDDSFKDSGPEKSDTQFVPSKSSMISSVRFSDNSALTPKSNGGEKTSEIQCPIAQDDLKPSGDDNNTTDSDTSSAKTVKELPQKESAIDGVKSETVSTAIMPRKTKPSLLQIQQGTKFYMSIDDLSPEYSGLPFVKKLKILNERQKLAELERKMAGVFMRSSSLDSSNTTMMTSGVMSGSYDAGDFDPTSLTRSHSEASAMEYVRTQQLSRVSYGKDDWPCMSQQTQTQLLDMSELPPHSPESNETLERRNLKSILKKLSASSLLSGSTEDASASEATDSPDGTDASPAVKPSAAEMRKLMRAPTIEGYAARHSKLTKSVTFNRDTLQSPPETTPISSSLPESTFPLPGDPSSEDKDRTQPPSENVDQTQTTSESVSSVHLPTIIPPVMPSITPAVSTIPSETEEKSITTTAIEPTISSTVTSMPQAAVQVTTTSESAVVSVTTISTTVVETHMSTTTAPQDTTTATTGTSPAATQSPVKKKPQVSFLVQHPQLPLNANQKNFFRPSLLLPSHSSDEEYFSEIIVGIKQVIQSHLEEIQNKFQSQFQSLEMEVKRRDEIISQLQQRIQELEHPQDHLQNGDDGDISDDLDEASDQPFMRGDSVDTVLTSPPPILPDEDMEELLGNNVRHRTTVSPRHHRLKRRSWEDHSEEETLELLDLPRSISPQHVWLDDGNYHPGNGVAKQDTVAVDLGSSDSDSTSSSSSVGSEGDHFTLEDASEYRSHNRDWEVQMLAREMERREGISQLQNEVRELKEAVSSSDLAQLSTSELDILERMLVVEDRKVRAAARALSLDSDESCDEHMLHVKKDVGRVRSPSLSSATISRKKLVKQRSTNEGGSIENLIHKTHLLKNRLLAATTMHPQRTTDASMKRQQFLNARSLSEHPDMPQTSRQTVRSGARSASSGNLTPVGRSSSSSSSSLFAFAPFMRGLGQFVRHASPRTSPASSTAQINRQHAAPSPPRTDSVEMAAVPTISQSCGASRHTDDPPPPDL